MQVLITCFKVIGLLGIQGMVCVWEFVEVSFISTLAPGHEVGYQEEI